MQAIGECNVQTERIVGVSMGSLVGALCASDLDTLAVQAKTRELLHSPSFAAKQRHLFGDMHGRDSDDAGMFSWYVQVRRFISAHRRFNRAFTGVSLLPQSFMYDVIESLVPNVEIQDLPIPLSIVCVDLLSGHRVVLEKGSLREAVLASMSIPGFFPPVHWQDMLLCDIGVFDSLPTSIARSYATDLVIGVDVGLDHARIEHCHTALEVMMRMQDIGEHMLRQHVGRSADIVIRPDVGHVPWFDFRNSDALVHAGHEAAHRSLTDYFCPGPEVDEPHISTWTWSRGRINPKKLFTTP
jgi:NTE family protein